MASARSRPKTRSVLSVPSGARKRSRSVPSSRNPARRATARAAGIPLVAPDLETSRAEFSERERSHVPSRLRRVALAGEPGADPVADLEPVGGPVHPVETGRADQDRRVRAQVHRESEVPSEQEVSVRQAHILLGDRGTWRLLRPGQPRSQLGERLRDRGTELLAIAGHRGTQDQSLGVELLRDVPQDRADHGSTMARRRRHDSDLMLLRPIPVVDPAGGSTDRRHRAALVRRSPGGRIRPSQRSIRPSHDRRHSRSSPDMAAGGRETSSRAPVVGPLTHAVGQRRQDDLTRAATDLTRAAGERFAPRTHS